MHSLPRDYTMRIQAHWRLISRLALAGVLAAALPLGFRGETARQQPTPGQEPQQPQRPIRVQVELVNLFATVRDGKKRLVGDLKQEEFRVFEEGVEQKVEFFSKERALPITLGMLMDTSGSEQHMLAAVQEASSRFLQHVMRKGDLAFVITFDTDVNLMSDLTGDLSQLEAGIQRARINAPNPGPFTQGPFPPHILSGGTNFYDAIYLACREKLAPEVGRKALVVVTDAEDTGSKVSLEEAVETAQRSDTVVHVLLVYDPRYGADFGAARKLADETGGRVISVRSEKDLAKAFAEISEELREQYTLGYHSSNSKGEGGFRKIKVETTRKGLKVLTRKGYYALRD